MDPVVDRKEGINVKKYRLRRMTKSIRTAIGINCVGVYLDMIQYGDMSTKRS
ncbi:hypothetical protein CROQUDRAFT_658031 [Cronartium quercuum f. sp. fusiforme G11]|uniref:Uncharacterized protein n=1 Tax=Cronartium quercuum f. sp. fusiforme G11 TaxID=708437 RepID=A0A9P6NH56_9BASI|nr:hypothetical protein CROQUDRAFT_658031 [Cronartium quercuum f. sp. fusiforme G11]